MTQRICHHLVAAYPNFNMPKFLARALSWIIKMYQKWLRRLSIIMKKHIKRYNITFKMQCDSNLKLGFHKRITLLYKWHTIYRKYFHYVLKIFQEHKIHYQNSLCFNVWTPVLFIFKYLRESFISSSSWSQCKYSVPGWILRETFPVLPSTSLPIKQSKRAQTPSHRPSQMPAQRAYKALNYFNHKHVRGGVEEESAIFFPFQAFQLSHNSTTLYWFCSL